MGGAGRFPRDGAPGQFPRGQGGSHPGTRAGVQARGQRLDALSRRRRHRRSSRKAKARGAVTCVSCVSFQFENEIITKLDHEVEGGRGDEQYKVLFDKM